MLELEKLNSEQREAVLDTSHNLLLLACAGSGKTRTITTKIAYYIEQGILRPWEILAVTFTNKAAAEMRERVASMLPDIDVSSIEMRTFHSFGAWVLRRNSREAMLNDNFGIYDESDSVALMQIVNPLMDKKVLKEFYKSISKAKDLGLDPDDLSLGMIDSHEDFRRIYKGYENALRATGNCDFADLILRPVELLKGFPEIREKYQRKFKLVLVDEYQDSNRMQFELLKLIVGENTQLCVVGDDDQSIYGFRGAELKNILTFAKSFSNVREIKLEKNYRSTSEILELAGALIAKNRMRHVKDIVSAVDAHGEKPRLTECATGQMEAELVVDRIRRSGSYDSTAIIYRTNAQSLPFEMELKRRMIPYKVVGSLKFYDREEVKDALALLFLVANRRDSINFRRIINKPSRGIGPKALDELLSYSEDVIDSLEAYSQKKTKAAEGARAFLSVYNQMKEGIENGESIGDVLLRGIVHSGLMSYYEKDPDKSIVKARKENIEMLISSFSSYGRGMASLYQYLENITLDTTTLGGTGKEDTQNSVVLITMHNTKGLEFDTVFVVGLEDEIIPGVPDVVSSELEEERRILYVALTRARRNLYMYYARRRMRWGYSQDMRPSRYLSDFPAGSYVSNSLVGMSSAKSFSTTVGAQVRRPRISSWNGPGMNTLSPVEEKKISKIPLSPGDVIYSELYGKGKVLSSDDTMASIEFLSGVKRLNRNYNEFKKLESASDKEKRTSFNVGDRVRSASYGEGVVTYREVKNAESGIVILKVKFSKGEVQLVEKYARLEHV